MFIYQQWGDVKKKEKLPLEVFFKNDIIQKNLMAEEKMASIKKGFIPYLFIFTCLIPFLQAQETLDWENPKIYGINKEMAHNTLMVYPDMPSALTNSRSSSPFFQSLNGTWKFHWVNKPADRPVEFYKPEFSVDHWD